MPRIIPSVRKLWRLSKRRSPRSVLPRKSLLNLYHPAGTKDYAPYVSQLIAAKPDVIFTPNWGNDLTLLLKQGRPDGNETESILLLYQ